MRAVLPSLVRLAPLRLTRHRRESGASPVTRRFCLERPAGTQIGELNRGAACMTRPEWGTRARGRYSPGQGRRRAAAAAAVAVFVLAVVAGWYRLAAASGELELLSR